MTKILVTGGSGFLGSHLKKVLEENPDNEVVAVGSYDDHLDLWGRGINLLWRDAVIAFMEAWGPFDQVYHLAGYNGGLAFNLKEPAAIFYKNTVMGLNLLDACVERKVSKVVCVVASCAYPEWGHSCVEGHWDADWRPREIMHENDFLDGPPSPTVACHGYAKRNLQLACQFFHQQYGLNAVCACPTTLFGPGDSYDPERTKVIGALVKKFVDAADSGANVVSLWGDGSSLREALYVEDCARLLPLVMERYEESSTPLNLGSGVEHSIKEFAEIIGRRAGFTGTVTWDTNKPNGQHRKRLDVRRMHEVLGVPILTPFEEAIDKTIADYRRRRPR